MTRDTCPKVQLSKQVVVQSLDPLGLAGPGAGVVRGRHQPRELLEVDLAVTVQVGLLDHGADLGLGHGLAQVVHRQPGHGDHCDNCDVLSWNIGNRHPE